MIPALYSALPDTVEVSGRAFPVRTDFRVWVEFELRLLDGTLTVPDAFRMCFCDAYPGNRGDAADALLTFYRGGEPIPAERRASSHAAARVYDFRQDAAVLYASFRQAYGLDLTVDTPHWWAFRAMLWGLPEDTPMAKLMHLRGMDTAGMPDRAKRRYDALKKKVAVRDASTRKETLSERDARMREYVKKRMETVKG